MKYFWSNFFHFTNHLIGYNTKIKQSSMYIKEMLIGPHVICKLVD